MNELSAPLHLQIDQRETTANTTEEGKALPVNCAQRGLKLAILLQDCDIKYNMVEYAKRQPERLKKLQRNDKEDVTTRDLRNDTMRKEEIDSNNSKNTGYSNLLLVKCLQVAECMV